MTPTSDLLVVEDVVHAFGGTRAVDKMSLRVQRGSSTALIGPNGAGKSTLVNVVAGALGLQAGRIQFDGLDVGRWPKHKRARVGLIRTFQISREFSRMTVLENLMVPAPNQAGETFWGAIRRPRQAIEDERRHLDRALDLLGTFGLYEMRDEYAGNMSGGQKRLLEMARAVMAEPRLLLLDEPMAGVNPALAERLVSHIRLLNESGITILMVEHNMRVVEEACENVVVMALGQPLAVGTMVELRRNPVVVKAYLGAAQA